MSGALLLISEYPFVFVSAFLGTSLQICFSEFTKINIDAILLEYPSVKIDELHLPKGIYAKLKPIRASRRVGYSEFARNRSNLSKYPFKPGSQCRGIRQKALKQHYSTGVYLVKRYKNLTEKNRRKSPFCGLILLFLEADSLEYQLDSA